VRAASTDEQEKIQELLEQLERDVLLFTDRRQRCWSSSGTKSSTHVYTYHYEAFARAAGSTRLAQDPSGKAAPGRLAHGRSSIATSLRRQDALFSWRKQENEGYTSGRSVVDGSGLRSLPPALGMTTTLLAPDGRHRFPEHPLAAVRLLLDAPVGILHRMNADGSGVRNLSRITSTTSRPPCSTTDGSSITAGIRRPPCDPHPEPVDDQPRRTGLMAYFGNR